MQAWMQTDLAEDTALAFSSARGGRLSSDGAQYLLAKHVAAASKDSPSLVGKHVTPHVLRHTTAMELLRADADRSVIAMWLGHESLENTQIYLQASKQTLH